MRTRVIPVPVTGDLGYFDETKSAFDRLDEWHVRPEAHDAVTTLKAAADYLRSKDIPVAFPTETVYGLGADATRSGSVKGIYAAKGRPSDNPLIVHVADLHMLRGLLGSEGGDGQDEVIPARYRPLIERFWPGPLTILLPNPNPSRLAPEVTAGLGTFGARMPSSPLALTLIKLVGAPLAGPSANASTKPSPTTAQHVKDDLDGRIEQILDGGSCRVGVESTVVDGLCDPPVVLRPGGIGMEELRSCPGWEDVVKAYKDHSEENKAAPRAPGMKYKHYSPKAKVVLYESGHAGGTDGLLAADTKAAATTTKTAINGGNAQSTEQASRTSVGVIRTKRWKKPAAGLRCRNLHLVGRQHDEQAWTSSATYPGELRNQHDDETVSDVFDMDLGEDPRDIAQGLFSALRELDRRGVDVIFVEGIDDEESDIAAAVMNRLRKAASEIRS